nr:hypothetical protein [Actinomycetota bacterium]
MRELVDTLAAWAKGCRILAGSWHSRVQEEFAGILSPETMEQVLEDAALA